MCKNSSSACVCGFTVIHQTFMLIGYTNNNLHFKSGICTWSYHYCVSHGICGFICAHIYEHLGFKYPEHYKNMKKIITKI